VAIVLALMSSVLWGTSDFLGGTASRRVPSAVVVTMSQATGLCAVSMAVLVTGGFGFDASWIAPAVLAGSTLAAGLVMFYAALASGAMGIVSPIAALGVLVPVAVGLLRGDSLSVASSLGVVLAILGIVAASGPDLHARVQVRSVVLAAFSAVCFGTSMTFLAEGARADPLLSLWGIRATSVLAVVIGLVWVRQRRPVPLKVRPRDAVLIVLAGLTSASANLLFQLASLRGYLSVVAVIVSLSPAATITLAWVVLHQRLKAVQVLGIAAALGGVALVSFG
jgi:drug/metabolite transporter (DMT)-like permease